MLLKLSPSHCLLFLFSSDTHLWLYLPASKHPFVFDESDKPHTYSSALLWLKFKRISLWWMHLSHSDRVIQPGNHSMRSHSCSVGHGKTQLSVRLDWARVSNLLLRKPISQSFSSTVGNKQNPLIWPMKQKKSVHIIYSFLRNNPPYPITKYSEKNTHRQYH